MSRTPAVPSILPLTDREHVGAGGTRFALLHVVAGERHHLGWFQLDDDPWRVGLVDAAAVAGAGVPVRDVRAETAEVLARLRAARDADDHEVPPPIGPIVNVLRHRVDRRRAIERLEAEVAEL